MTLKRGAVRALEALLGDQVASRIAFGYRDNLSSDARAYDREIAGRRSRSHLAGIRNTYTGRRCFIIGNGPSLATMDLSPLQTEFTFGLNRGYLLFDRIGAPTTFLVSVNRHVIDQFGNEMVASCPRTYFSWNWRSLIDDPTRPIFVRSSQGPRFCENVARQGAWEGATVTYVAMQLAFHMGFDEVYLIGVDHSFSSKGPAHKLVTSSSTDRDHFDPTYFGPGIRWQLPDLDTSEIAYVLARRHFESAGRRILDATVNGKLTVFPKVEYESLFGD